MAGDLGGKKGKTPLEDGCFEDSTITRPDICFAVNQVSQQMQAPKIHHWNMVERILRYLRDAPGQGVWMGCNNITEVVGYCDDDWAGDKVDRRSTTGYCTFIGGTW